MLSDNKRKAAIDSLTGYAAELRTEIERTTRELSRELERVEKSLAALTGGEPSGTVSPAATTKAGEYAGLGPQGAVEKFLADNRDRTVRSTELAAILRERGFTVTNPRLLKQQVLIALHRAVAKGFATVEEIDGKRAFRLATRIKDL